MQTKRRARRPTKKRKSTKAALQLLMKMGNSLIDRDSENTAVMRMAGVKLNKPIPAGALSFEEIHGLGLNNMDTALRKFYLKQLTDKKLVSQVLSRIADGSIYFEDIPFIFRVGSEVVADYQGELVGAKVINLEYKESWIGPFWSFMLNIVSVDRRSQMCLQVWETRISRWDTNKTRNLENLNIRKITSELKDSLVERGRVYQQVVSSPSYMEYSSAIYIPNWFGWTPLAGHGRVIIDQAGCQQLDPNMNDNINGDLDSPNRHEKNIDNFVLTDDLLFMTWPYVAGFSFRQKRWAAMKVSALLPAVFDKKAFNYLVLDTEKKTVVKTLVENSNHSFNDIVAGKSGGLVFLLHGAPGSGKTLTAEATAEVLERPLYMVSVGELGTDAEALERKLGQILELAERWNAVLLLDEADVFLEQRTDRDIERNAMVGIFLRLLEYFNGVMFLTTNRVKNFDKAFHSRISLAIHYPPVSDEIRQQIWTNLLSAAKIKNVDVSQLAMLDINGRQIKNCIRLTQTMAHGTKTKVTTDALIRMSKFADEFTDALEHGENYA